MPIAHTTQWALREPASLPAIHPQDPAVPLLALYLPAISAAFCKKHAARETPLSDSLHGWSCMLPEHNPACAAGIKPQIDLPTTTDAATCAGASRQLLSQGYFRYQRACCCLLRFANSAKCCPNTVLPVPQASGFKSTYPPPLMQPLVLVRADNY
jgi:hypothetical protein